jgi:hypothetical protein
MKQTLQKYKDKLKYGSIKTNKDDYKELYEQCFSARTEKNNNLDFSKEKHEEGNEDFYYVGLGLPYNEEESTPLWRCEIRPENNKNLKIEFNFKSDFKDAEEALRHIKKEGIAEICL